MEEAVVSANNGLDLSLNFYEEEWLRVHGNQFLKIFICFMKKCRI